MNHRRPGARTADTPPRPRRTAINRQKDRPGQFLRLRGIFDQPTLWEFAAGIPDQSAEGARRKLPTVVYTSMPALAAIWRSFSAAETQLSEPETWAILCRTLCEMQEKYRPADEPFDLEALLATPPLTAQNFYDARRGWMAPHLSSMEEAFEEAASQIARETGLADPDGEGSPNDLTRERTAGGDGKVTRQNNSRYRALNPDEENRSLKIRRTTHVVDRHTGEIVASSAMEGGAHLYMTGDRRPVVGHKTVRFAVRGDQTNSTVILAVRRLDTKDEAACAVKAAIDIKRRLPGLLAITYDGALRGKHIAQLAREARLVTIAPVTAKKTEREGKKGGRRVEKSGLAAVYPHQRPDGTECSHTWRYIGGRMHEEQINDAGKRVLVPCTDPFIRFRDNKSDHRMYLEWDVMCASGLPAGASPVSVGKLTWTVTDQTSKFNVAENLRALPPGSPRYDTAHGWRQTVENDNHQSDSRKVLARGRSTRADWNHINEIGWAIMQNGVTAQRHRHRQAEALDEPRAA